MRAVPRVFTLMLAVVTGVSLAAGELAQALLFGIAALLALSVAVRVAMLERQQG